MLETLKIIIVFMTIRLRDILCFLE